MQSFVTSGLTEIFSIYDFLLQANNSNFKDIEISEVIKKKIINFIKETREKITHQKNSLDSDLSLFTNEQLVKHAYNLLVYSAIRKNLECRKEQDNNYLAFFKDNNLCKQALRENNPFFLKFHLEMIQIEIQKMQSLQEESKLSPQANFKIWHDELIRLADALILLGDEENKICKWLLLAMTHFTLANCYYRENNTNYDLLKAKRHFKEAFTAAHIAEDYDNNSKMTLDFFTLGEKTFANFPIHSFTELKSFISNLKLWQSLEMDDCIRDASEHLASNADLRNKLRR